MLRAEIKRSDSKEGGGRKARVATLYSKGITSLYLEQTRHLTLQREKRDKERKEFVGSPNETAKRKKIGKKGRRRGKHIEN